MQSREPGSRDPGSPGNFLVSESRDQNYCRTGISILIDDEVNCDSDDEEDDGFQIGCKEDEPEFTDEIYLLIRKERSVLKLFRRPPTKNDEILQKYIKAEFGKEIQLLIDVKIRWNSLHFMLERFDKVTNCI
jgi:hypothetical protein